MTKGNVTAVFGPQNVSNPNRDIELFGECRDTTTTKDTKVGWSASRCPEWSQITCGAISMVAPNTTNPIRNATIVKPIT